MGYNDKYPDMSAMYAIQFEHENKLKNKIKELEAELDRTRKALGVAKEGLNKYTDASGNWWYGYEFQGLYEDYAGEYADKALEQITTLEQKN